MKRIILISGLIVAICLSSFGRKFVSAGDTHSPLGKYKIEVDDNYMMINGSQHKPYFISFENSDMEVRVAVTMEKGCRKYYVLSDNLSLQYVSNRHYFGVEMLDGELDKDGFRTSTESLNKSEYFHQKAITGGEKWKRDKTPLIAVFFPQLINNTEEILASK
jgi:hypothetical protein